jgi:hypothetical protein
MDSYSLVTDLIQNESIQAISGNNAAILAEIQREGLFKCNAFKEPMVSAKLKAARKFKKLWLGPILQNACSDAYEVHRFAPRFWEFADESADSLAGKLDGAIVILLNNDFSGASIQNLQAFHALCSNCPNTLFIVWDHDNHHWLQLSLMLALIFDLVVPAHPENLAVLARYNSNVLPPVFTGSIQWTQGLLKQNLDQIMDGARSPEPLGKHAFYSSFVLRNQIVQTLSVHPHIGFTDGSYRNNTPQQNFDHWAGHKTHFCALVNNDIPYRVFDALITGGVACVPRSLAVWEGMHPEPDRLVFYGCADVFNGSALFKRAEQRFDALNAGLSRAGAARLVSKLHVDARIQEILSRALCRSAI